MDNQDHFKKEYQVFQESTFYAKLEQKFTPLPYWKKYRTIRRIAFVASYLFNALSGITASSLFYFFLLKLTREEAAFVATLMGIVLLEIFKRKLSSLTFKELLMYSKVQYLAFLLLFILSSISILSSYYGSKELVFNFSSPAQIVDLDFATADLDFQIASIDEQIEEARATKWAGTTTSDSQKTITSLNSQKESLLAEALRIREKTDLENGKLEEAHLQKITIDANHFALLTLLLELLFLVSAFYLQYYDYRSYIEFYRPVATVATAKETTLPSHQEGADTPSTHSIPTDVLLGAIKNAKSNISAFQGKIKSGQGTLSSNERGIKRWEEKLSELENLLPKNGVEKHA